MQHFDFTSADQRETAWDEHYSTCSDCQSYEGDGTLEEAVEHLCPVGQELARGAIEALA